jgi:hypothetical protein
MAIRALNPADQPWQVAIEQPKTDVPTEYAEEHGNRNSY